MKKLKRNQKVKKFEHKHGKIEKTMKLFKKNNVFEIFKFISNTALTATFFCFFSRVAFKYIFFLKLFSIFMK